VDAAYACVLRVQRQAEQVGRCDRKLIESTGSAALQLSQIGAL